MGHRLRLALLPLLLATAANALAPGNRAVSLFGGGSFPGGGVGDNGKIGFAGGAGLRSQFTDRFSAVIDAEYLRFGDRTLASGINSGADVLGFGLLARFDLPSEKRGHAPFLAVGPALNRVTRRATAPGLDDRHDDWEAGIVVAGGTMISASDAVSFGPVGRYRSLGKFGYALEADLEIAFTLAGGKK